METLWWDCWAWASNYPEYVSLYDSSEDRSNTVRIWMTCPLHTGTWNEMEQQRQRTWNEQRMQQTWNEQRTQRTWNEQRTQRTWNGSFPHYIGHYVPFPTLYWTLCTLSHTISDTMYPFPRYITSQNGSLLCTMYIDVYIALDYRLYKVSLQLLYTDFKALCQGNGFSFHLQTCKT